MLFGELSPVLRKLRNIAGRAGFHLTLAFHAQSKLDPHAGAEDGDLRNSANLELWPKILPHYRYIRFLERGPDRNVVVMAATRSGIPISWTSEQIIDRDKLEIHFHHLKAWTKGMRVVWTFSESGRRRAGNDFTRFAVSIPPLAPIVNPIIGDFFIHNVANKTLHCMKAYVEARADKVTA